MTLSSQDITPSGPCGVLRGWCILSEKGKGLPVLCSYDQLCAIHVPDLFVQYCQYSSCCTFVSFCFIRFSARCSTGVSAEGSASGARGSFQTVMLRRLQVKDNVDVLSHILIL